MRWIVFLEKKYGKLRIIKSAEIYREQHYININLKNSLNDCK